MTNLEWKNEYNLGIQKIDFEHQSFFQILKEISDYLEKPTPANLKVRKLQELVLYAQFHFYSEETLMLEINYPDFERHQKEHLDLLEKLNVKIHSIDTKVEDLTELIIFLREWLFNHTVNEDRKIGQYYHSNKDNINITEYF